MPVTVPVVNQRKDLVSLVHMGPQGREEYIWQSHGIGTGEDLLELPEYVTETPNFTRQVRRGILRVLTPEELASWSRPSYDNWASVQEAETAKLMANMDRSPQEYILQKACIAPEVGNNPCAGMVTIRHTEETQRPPLCERHSHLVSYCVLTVDESIAPQPGQSNLVWRFLGQATR
jgi:hypothetical protein